MAEAAKIKAAVFSSGMGPKGRLAVFLPFPLALELEDCSASRHGVILKSPHAYTSFQEGRYKVIFASLSFVKIFVSMTV